MLRPICSAAGTGRSTFLPIRLCYAVQVTPIVDGLSEILAHTLGSVNWDDLHHGRIRIGESRNQIGQRAFAAGRPTVDGDDDLLVLFHCYKNAT